MHGLPRMMAETVYGVDWSAPGQTARASYTLVRNEATVPGIHQLDEQPGRNATG